MLKKASLGVIVVLLLVFNSLHFWKLDAIPAGYQVDELASAVTLQCFAEKGCDAELSAWPLFGAMRYGQDKPPTYIYPGMLWARAFGSTVPSLRAFGVSVFLIGIAGLLLLAQQLFGKSFALVVALAASCSPWTWVANRVAIESNFAPVFAIWGLYFFWRSTAWRDWAAAGFLFVCAMYAYPPARLQIPLMIASLSIFEWGRRSVKRPAVLSLSAVFVLSLLPMALKYMQGALSRRFDEIGVFNKDYLYVVGKAGSAWDIASIFVHNYSLHLSPDFLFVSGDSTYMYSTRHSGIFSWLDMGALVILTVFLILAGVNAAWRENPVIKYRRWLLLLAANFFIGIIPSALTNQDLPNALRICGSWPFMMLFTGLLWWSAAQCLTALWPVIALTGILGGGLLMVQYFTVYPQESKVFFGSWAKEIAERLRTEGDWKNFLITFNKQQYHCRYFLAHQLGMTCKEARDEWLQAAEYLKRQS